MKAKTFWMIPALAVLLSAHTAYSGKDRDGGFEYENSREILNRASAELAEAVQKAQPGTFPEFAPGWNQERLAAVIRDVKHDQDPNHVTTGTNPTDSPERRMFDYDEEAGTISALLLYFEQFSRIPVFTSESSAVGESIREVKRRLLHEAAHLAWGFGERRAKEISVQILDVLAPREAEPNALPLTVEVVTEKDAFLALTGYELKQSSAKVTPEGNPLVTKRAERVCAYYGFERAVGVAIGWYELAKTVKYVDDSGSLKPFIAQPWQEMAYYRYPKFQREPVEISEAEYDPNDSSHKAVVRKVWKLGKFSSITCLRNPSRGTVNKK